MDDVRKEFLNNIRHLCDEVKRRYGYRPNRILSIVYDNSTSDEFKIAKIKSLIRKEVPEGLINMWELGGLDALRLTIEYLIVNGNYSEFFTEEEISMCREKREYFERMCKGHFPNANQLKFRFK